MGGHGQVVYDLAKQTNKYTNIYYLDDNSKSELVKGKVKDYINYKDDEFYIAFGNNELRYKLYLELMNNNCVLATIIHPTSYISDTVKIGVGCVIMPYCIINTNSIIKDCVIINIGAIVDHDCIINDCCHISPGGIVKAYNNLPSLVKVDSGEVIPLNYYK